MAGVVMAGLLAGAAGTADASGGDAEAHARAVVSAQMRDMGVDTSVIHNLQTVELPGTQGLPGLAVCGTAFDADPRTQPWGLNFIAFYERDDVGSLWTIGDVVFMRIGGADIDAAADLCEGARDPTRSRAAPERRAAPAP